MRIHYVGISEAGCKREENQDRIFCGAAGESGLFLVADGMGGHSSGSFASSCIRHEAEAVWEAYAADFQRNRTVFLNEVCENILEKANRRILNSTPKGEVCGSTAVMLRIGEEDAGLFSCGDSRCYRIRKRCFGKQMKLLTADDVWENRKENIRKLSRKEIQMHKNRGKLVRTVGTEQKFSCSFESLQLKDGDLFVLCSDGIYKYVEKSFFRQILLQTAKKGKNGLREGVECLREKAYRAGAPDNLSLILVWIEKPKAERRHL